MNRAARMVVALMVVLLPLRALAAVTIGDCAAGQHGAAHQHEAQDHDHGSTHDHEHCASASFVASAGPLPLAGPSAPDRVTQRSRLAASFVPDHLDPPPLSL